MIIHITPFYAPNIGGVETYLSDLIDISNKNKIKNIVITYSPLSTNAKAPFHVKSKHNEIFRFPHIGFNLFHKLEKFPLLNFIYLTPYLLIASIVICYKYRHQKHVIHAHGLNSAIIGYILKLIYKWPLIINIYSTYDNVSFSSLFFKTIKYVLNCADHVLTQSNQSIQQLIVWGINPKIIGRYYHWIDLNRFKPATRKPNRQTNFLFVGRLIPQKGVNLVVKLAKIFPQYQFNIVGTGPQYSQLQKLVQSNLKLLGDISYQKLHLIYQSNDVFLFPSLYAEGWGRTAMEAIACGLPVLGSNRGAIPENLDSTVSILFPPTLSNFKKNITKITKLKNNCHSYAKKHFSKSNFNNLQKIYSSYQTAEF
ncbi:MAG: glycosyltransferase family 4 protein [Candidatus Shapirobacteria bacterium]